MVRFYLTSPAQLSYHLAKRTSVRYFINASEQWALLYRAGATTLVCSEVLADRRAVKSSRGFLPFLFGQKGG